MMWELASMVAHTYPCWLGALFVAGGLATLGWAVRGWRS